MRTTKRLLVIVAVIVALLAACGDGGSDDSAQGGGDTSAGETTTTAEETTTSIDEEAARMEITEAFQTVFDGSLSFDERITGLEMGEQLREPLEGVADILGEQASASTGEVSEVSFTGDGADVTFSVLLDGQEALPDQQGTAVSVDGEWKMSALTLCNLLSLTGQDIPQCTDIINESVEGG